MWHAHRISTTEPPDEEAVYRQVGRFVVTFQALEAELLQLARFALDPEHTGRGRREAAGLSFGHLVARTSEAVAAFLDEHRPSDETDVRGRLDAFLAECRELAIYRNRVVHSAYLFLEAGDELVAVIRSDMARGDGDDEVDLDQEALTGNSFEEAMTRISGTAFGLGQCRLQLIAWYKRRD